MDHASFANSSFMYFKERYCRAPNLGLTALIEVKEQLPERRIRAIDWEQVDPHQIHLLLPRAHDQRRMKAFTSLISRRLTLNSSDNKVRIYSPIRSSFLSTPDLIRSSQPDMYPQHGEIVTAKLPPELLIEIFSILDRNSRDLEVVTMVCRRWREIAVQTPYLWTKIVVDLRSYDKKQSKRFLSHVELLFNRASDLRLDVEWHGSGTSKVDSLFYTLFRKKGTFNRWRTLTIDLEQNTILPAGEIRGVDNFSSLEYLKFVSNPPPALLDVIKSTVTPKLDTLVLGSKFRCPPAFVAEYGKILGLIRTLHIWNRVILPPGLFPQNVIRLQAYAPPQIPMPHVRHLFLKKLPLDSFYSFHPDNLVTLSVTVSIKCTVAGFTITLPRLLWLGIRGEACFNIEAFKLPSLHTLCVGWDGQEDQPFGGSFVTGLRTGFEAPKLLLLFLKVYLDRQTTLDILEYFPQISRADLSFSDVNHGQDVLSHVFPVRRDFSLFPNLDFLRVNLHSPPPNVAEWEQLMETTVRNIGAPFWRLLSKWPDGRCASFIGTGNRQRIECIYPWHLEK